MIKCKGCGKENPTYALTCPACSAPPELTDAECRDLLHEVEEAMGKNDFVTAVDIYKFLAAAGSVDGERELGLILEKGQLLPRDMDMAVQYFYSAAQKGDPIAALKYSRLVVGNRALADFWLAYSALVGCKEAYPEVFTLYASYKERETAAYYCWLLADEGDTDAKIEMGRRHLYGDGVEQNEKMSKWYIEQIDHTPLHAIKLCRRIEAVEGKSVRPEFPRFNERKKITEKLLSAARKFGYHKIMRLIAENYSESGSKDANVFLALLHVEGIEFPQNVEEGIVILENAMAGGSVMAAKCLGDLFSRGEYIEQNRRTATAYYRRAAEMGGTEHCESLGDIFHNGEVTEPDYALAIELYERGAKAGDYACQRKLKAMEQEREINYVEASKLERTSPESAFPLFKKSVDAGYTPAHARIGWYYERGIGTKKNNKAAYTHYKAAYDAGDKRAIESLGRCYARGIGVAFDFKRASELLSVAREMGSHSADRELYRIYENKKRHMVRSLYSTATRLYYNRNYDVARSMYEVCMELGLGEATYSIGCLFEFGITKDSDRKVALQYYKKAYDQGYRDPRQYHKQCMLRIWKQG